jgi:AraC-like DNA-binding protein
MEHSNKNLCETHILGAQTREQLVLSHRGRGEGHAHMHVAGLTEAAEGYRFVRTKPAFGMLLVTEAGAGRVLVGGRWQECGAGQAYLTTAGVPHAYHLAEGGTWRLHWVIYGSTLAPPGMEAGGAPRIISVDTGGLRLAIEGLCGEKGGRADPGLLNLWRELVDRQVLRVLNRPPDEGRLDRLWQAVREDLGGEWSLRRMASLMGMGEENLRRLCQQALRRPPFEELTRLRMEAAGLLLRHSTEKVSAVAARVGYADPFAFSTAFKRSTGHSPKAFRERHGGPAF